MTVRTFTVKMKPEVGKNRVQLAGLVPEDFLCRNDCDLIVEVETRQIVAGDYTATVMLMIGDWPRGRFISRSDYKTVGHLSTLMPARLGWNVIVSFEEIPEMLGHRPLLQRENTDYHVVARVSSRPA